ncbi:hypothetical protein D0864_04686 [Hortaea werneckii]|uniref:Uncharacterized protein n=1 Tax=Hortaea werneckii TaxID=91943 RepID=A0A3M7GAG2_HORWE|nr:hypothetical protein D0864_04686 [Hortaea werneckii]
MLAFLGRALAAPTQNTTTFTTTPTMVTNPSTVPHVSPTTTTTAISSSTPCPILIENTPWLLTNITHFTPSLPSENHPNSTFTTTSSFSPSSSASGFISFSFADTNSGLELETRCFRTLLPPRRDRHSSSEGNPNGGGTYYPCEDGRVRFAYTAATASGEGKGEGKGEGEGEGELKVGRGYRDDW